MRPKRKPEAATAGLSDWIPAAGLDEAKCDLAAGGFGHGNRSAP